MRIGFPHMGTSHIAFKSLIEGLGKEPIVPDKPTGETLSIGTKLAPEFACIPFKITLGTYVELLERGADVIINTGGIGPCRAGYYAPLQKKILDHAGYDFEMITFEPPLSGIRDFLGKIRKVVAPAGWVQFYRAFRIAWAKLAALDEAEYELHRLRPRELERGRTERVFGRALCAIDKAATVDEVKQAQEDIKNWYREVPRDEQRKPLKIGIIGEIYVVLEPAANHEVEKALGELGCEVERSIFLTRWTKDNSVVNLEGDVKSLAGPFLSELVGGHGQNNIGEIVRYAKRGFDGVVHLAPFSCIPEIVCRSLLPKVTKVNNLPVLSFLIDEQTGTAGMQTRLEAFVDMLERKRRTEGYVA